MGHSENMTPAASLHLVQSDKALYLFVKTTRHFMNGGLYNYFCNSALNSGKKHRLYIHTLQRHVFGMLAMLAQNVLFAFTHNCASVYDPPCGAMTASCPQFLPSYMELF